VLASWSQQLPASPVPMEMAMSRNAVACCLVLLVSFSSAAGEETRTFPDARCTYTLPGPDWEFLDPKLLTVDMGKGDNLVLARTQKGRGFHLRTMPLAPGEKVTPRAFESFEFGFIKAGNMKKLNASRLTFKGLPSYQFDAVFPDGKGITVRLLYANKLLYILQAVNTGGPLDAKDAEPIFQGFNFIGTPEPVAMAEAEIDPSFERGRIIGQGCFSLMVMVGIVVGVYFLVRNRWKTTKPG
jgi:hypothetical protein